MNNSIEFGYHQKNQANLSINSTVVSRINSSAFDNPNSCFFSCNTATPNSYGASFAQTWVNKTGGTTWAIYEKSDYGNLNNINNWRSIVKPERQYTGYRQNGSDYYPIPSAKRNAYWLTFASKVAFR